MAASLNPDSENLSENQFIEEMKVNPGVNFLYKTMIQRDPRKRRVKPVAENLVQINFGGLDEDSEEDSDFDIGQLSQDKSDSGGGESNNENEKDDDDNDDDGMETDESSEESGSENATSNAARAKKPVPGGRKREGGKDAGVDVELGKGSEEEIDDDDDDDDLDTNDSDEEDDEFGETSNEEEDEDTDGNESDDEEPEEDRDDEDNSRPSSGKAKNSGSSGLQQMLDMIDSDEDDEDYVPRKKKKKKPTAPPAKSTPVKKPKLKSKKGKPNASESSKSEGAVAAVPSERDVPPQSRIKVIVCCVCLSDRSADDDEIVECDNCGISVHEGCYGISESHSAASTESSASTEPWFCDACKAGVKPVCELCPNTWGIFKETDNGKWVHIVCALYTPGVAFGDVDRLSMVTLFEMPYSKWGARECSLCVDSRFSQTGVCINCDAGMCKAYFHVTCAQREGLLAEVTAEDAMEVADPFFAYCKLHADKHTSKMKRRNWLAIQSHTKTNTPASGDENSEKLRFQRKLQHHMEKYSIAKLKKPPSWVPDQKMVRHLHTSPSAVRGFLRKAELMGVITQAQSVPVESQEARKKAQGQPAFTADFITYFMERNMKLENLKANSAELSSQNQSLQSQERLVRRKYDELAAKVKELDKEETALRKQGESLCGILQSIYGKPVPNLPDVFKQKKRVRSPNKKEAPPTPESELFHQCGICGKTTDQHLLVKCDSCKKHYHLGCLNPPLTRMPKKTKLFGWQCQFCALSSSDGSVKEDPDPDKPRKLRETIKEPEKYFHMSHIQESLVSQRRKTLSNRRSQQRRKTAQAKKVQLQKKQQQKHQRSSPGSRRRSTSFSPRRKKGKSPISSPAKASPGADGAVSGLSAHTSPAGKSPSPEKRKQRKEEPAAVQEMMCVVCNGTGTPADTIRCDECMLCYHIACLDPPVKKSPKVRGYAWHCQACVMDGSEEEESLSRRKTKSKDGSESVKAKITLPSGRQGREASSRILFDIDVSSDEPGN